MLVGVPKEIKNEEHRVGLTPRSVQELIAHGHKVLVEHNAGIDIGLSDANYQAVGANIAATAAEVYSNAELIVKVKEPQISEYALLRPGQILFTYLHLAPDPRQAAALIQSGCIAIGYETVTSRYNDLPLLSPMSQIAGRLAMQVGAHYLEKPQGGSGILLSGVPGVAPGKIVVIGGGMVGTSAMRIAMGFEANITVIDTSLHRLQELDFQFGGRIRTIFATQAAIEKYVTNADLVIGAVLMPGEAAPKVVKKVFLKKMRPGSVIVDVAIDQGGCIESSRPTSHAHPTFVEEGIIHYCVTNMPGAVPRTATFALNNATLPFVLELADKGVRALLENIHLQHGLNVYQGEITYEGVAKALGKTYRPPHELLLH